MEFVRSSSHGTITIRIQVIDGPVMPHPNSSTGKKIKADYVSFVFQLGASGVWTVDGWGAVQMGGTVLKKDGSEGKETWGGTVHYGWDRMPRYGWVRKLRDAVQPEGAPVLPFRLSGLENDDLEDAS